MLPYATVHWTAVFWVPVTVAVNGAVWPLVNEIQVGTSDTATGGCRVTVAWITVPLLLVAVTVTVLVLKIWPGAVYIPEVLI
jgi:hypothetical protein